MSRESVQHKLDRVRTPAVHITYDVEHGGAIETKELPFVAGVLADLSAESSTLKIKNINSDRGYEERDLPRLGDRSFDEIDRDNFDDVMAKYHPEISLDVVDKLSPEEQGKDPERLKFNLQFKSLADFHPENVAEHVEPLRELLILRKQLSSLQNSMPGDTSLEKLLREAIEQTEKNRPQK